MEEKKLAGESGRVCSHVQKEDVLSCIKYSGDVKEDDRWELSINVHRMDVVG